MKKLILCASALLAGCMALGAQEILERPSFGSNWSVGVNGGVTTPMSHHAFFGSMRGLVGLEVAKQLTPVFGLGVEGYVGFNTLSWNHDIRSNAYASMDNTYLGAFSTINLTRLFRGFSCNPGKFSLEAQIGAGWGHDCWAKTPDYPDRNYFATKAGLNFNYAFSRVFTLSLKPSVTWDMSNSTVAQTSCAYNINRAAFNFLVGLHFNIGKSGFRCAVIADDLSAQVADLNNRINSLRESNAQCQDKLAGVNASNAQLANALAACQAKGPKVVEQNNNSLQSVRYIFYKNASSVITPDQQPNVEMIAQYLKNHPQAKVNIDGYASPTGPEELNIKLAAARAESVKNALIKKYGIKADRIQAQGHGIGSMFSEESWNRVAVCILDK